MPTNTSRPSRSHGTRNKRRTTSPSRGGARKFNKKSNTKKSGSKHFHNNRGKNSSRGKRKMPTFNPSQFINTNPVNVVEEVYVPKNSFGTFGLDDQLVTTITKMGIASPSPIQDQIIPQILKGRDVIGLAETGTGKTAAFLVPIIQKTIHDRTRQTIILAPTRELAIQIEHELKKLSHGFKLYSTVCVGGMNIYPQIKGLRQMNHFIIGTPGRVLDLINRGNLKLNDIRTVILDEADRMLDMGFINDMRSILSLTPKDRETLFFSATMSKGAEQLVKEFLHDPITVSVKKKDVTNSIEQDVVPHNIETKFDTLLNLLSQPEFKRVLVFGEMKHSVEKLARRLVSHGVKAESIHGNKTHNGRQRALQKFKKGESHVLVATDVAARGIHVDDVTHVINYDLPSTFEDYVHRIGRTGRGTKRGKALTFTPTKQPTL